MQVSNLFYNVQAWSCKAEVCKFLICSIMYKLGVARLKYASFLFVL